MKKRLFVAIPLPEPMQATFSEYKKNFKANDIRWTLKENLHITVFFLGDVIEDLVPKIVMALQNVTSNIKQFRLEFEKTVFAPPNKPPRMIWGQFYKNENYTLLSNAIAKTLNLSFQIPLENSSREIIPHVTIARIKNPNSISEVELKPLEIENLEVTSCQLIESTLSSGGSIYSVVEKFILKV